MYIVNLSLNLLIKVFPRDVPERNLADIFQPSCGTRVHGLSAIKLYGSWSHTRQH